MITFENFHSVEGVPIYLQMIRHVKEGLAAGQIADGDELPSRRIVSATLAVNPNTVQKAYRQLEEEGLIQSRPGAGSHITAAPAQVEEIRRELFRREVQETVTAMKRMGLGREEAVELLRRLYDEEEER
jgi:GntR family transcriptional regulator